MKALKVILSVLLVLLIGAGTVGLALIPTASRAATTWGVKRYANSVDWISDDEMLQAALSVWGFAVTGDPATLPGEINGEEAFPPDQVEHLRDVQTLLNAAWTMLIVTAVGASALSVFYARLYGRRALGRTLIASGAAILGLILVVGGAALIDFDRFFDLFHRVLFPGGVWIFSGSSLLISCFPESFWMFLGSIWLAGIVILALAFLGLGVFLGRRVEPAPRLSV